MANETIAKWRVHGSDSAGEFSQTKILSAIRNGLRDLQKADLYGVNFYGMDLSKVDFRGANLKDANLSQAHLFQTNFSGAILDGIDFEDVNLRHTEIEMAFFRDTQHTPKWIIQGLDERGSFSQQRLVYAIKNGFRSLRGANLYGVSLVGVALNEADLRDVNLREANLRRINLRYSDLSEADFSKANLVEADLTGAVLQRTTLTEADFTRAIFLEADLRDARLILATVQEANLNRSKLTSANLKKANLQNTNFEDADMGLVHLTGANLVKANLIGANLTGAAIRNAQLEDADLQGSHLPGADLTGANLCRANLCRANLHRAILMKANLSFANLSHVNLIMANLIQTILHKTIITGAKLYGTARDDWNIDAIQCDYVYWDTQGERRTPEERAFKSGEFEELYRQIPTFEYYFTHGFTALDAVVMARAVQTINAQYPEFELALDSFHSRGQPHAKFAVLHADYKEEAKRQIATEYESRIAALEGKQEQLMELFSIIASKPQIGELVMGDQKIGKIVRGDNIEVSGTVTQLTTGDKFYDHAQQISETLTPQSSQQEIIKLLSFIQQELPKLPLPEEIKEEVSNEVKGAEIQATKEQPDKKKIAGKLKSATEVLKESAKTVKEAVMIGNLLGKAIDWCGEQWIEWIIS